MPSDPHPWVADLSALHAQIWTRLVRGVGDRRAATRHPTLATVSPDGLPEARTVVLRAADPAQAQLEMHTDLASAKVAALRANPRAALHVWDATARLQMRLSVVVTILSGAEVRETWDRLAEPAWATYGPDPAPGSPIPAALAYTPRATPDAFAVLRCAVEDIDALHLGPQHRRARFTRASGWHGTWLVP